jgi:hypothetical protein
LTRKSSQRSRSWDVAERRLTHAAIALAAALTVSCGARLAKLPSAAGEPASDMPAALAQATTACSAASSLTAEIAASGSVGGHRLRARLLGGFTTAAVRLEAVAPAGQPFFIFVASGRDATLLLPRDDRVLEHGEPAAVLEVIAGVPLEPSELLQTLTGCATSERWTTARAIGADWRVAEGEHGAKLYLHRDSSTASWRVVTRFHGGEGTAWSWRADYDDVRQGLPASVHLVSADLRRFDLKLALSQVETGVALDADAFRVQIPRAARRITLEELRRSGPFGQASDAR